METRVDYLKRINKQNNIIKEIEVIFPYLKGYLSILEPDISRETALKVYSKLAFLEVFEIHGANEEQIVQNCIGIIKENSEKILAISSNFLIEICKEEHFDHENYILHISSKSFLNEIETFLDVIGFSSGLTDLMIVSENLENGFYIERTEYSYYILKIWGL